MRVSEFAFAVLCNSLWQAPVIALLTFGVLQLARGASASTRYAAWLIALIASVLVPIGTSLITMPANVPAVTAPAQSVAAPPQTQTTVVAAHTEAKNATAAQPPSRASSRRFQLTVPRAFVVAALAVWAIVALAFLVRLFVDLLALERLKRDALPLPIAYRDELERWPEAVPLLRTVRLCVSSNTEVPVAVGLFDSMILLPSHLLESFSAREIDQIALHELAHLQRADDWSNGLQRLLVALFFFNPAVRLIAQRLDLEREVACDDHVVELTRDVRPYAKCLAKMAEVTAWPHHALAAPGVFVTRKSISVRIEQLLKRKSTDRARLSPAVLGAGVAAACAFFAAATLLTPVIASPVPDAAPRTVAQAPAHTAVSHPQTHASPQPVRKIVVYVTPSPAAAKPVFVAAATPQPKRTARPARTPHPQHTARPHSGSAPSCVGCSLAGVDWSNRDLHGMNLSGSNLADVDLRNADLRDANLSGVNLSGARLAGANLTGTSLRGANLAGISLAGVDLSRADISGANIDARHMDPASVRVLLVRCTGCNFAGADLRGQNLRGLRVTGANLDGADLRGADLSDATFSGVNFNGAQFQGARMDGTQFNGCNFAGVDMRTADFSHAKITGSNLSGAILQ